MSKLPVSRVRSESYALFFAVSTPGSGSWAYPPKRQVARATRLLPQGSGVFEDAHQMRWLRPRICAACVEQIATGCGVTAGALDLKKFPTELTVVTIWSTVEWRKCIE